MEIKNYLGEVWRPVKGFEGFYEVSNFGRVRSNDRYVESLSKNKKKYVRLLRGSIIKTRCDSGGYNLVALCKNAKYTTMLIHRLVARAFPEICGEWFDGCQVNHKNEIKTDNRAENLEVCDRLYNINYGTGRQRHREHMLNNRIISKPIIQETKYELVIMLYPSINEASRQTKIPASNICNCLKGKYKTAGGFIWKYAETQQNPNAGATL